MESQQANRGQVLILDANKDRAAELARSLNFLKYDALIPTRAQVSENGTRPLAFVVGKLNNEFDKTIRDYRETNGNIPFICFPESIDSQSGVSQGHSWLLDLPLRRSQVLRLLQRAERYQGAERRQRLTGTSHSIRGVRSLIEQVADFDTSVLVTGGSGTGKELVARTIHDLSARADKPFVPINCAAIPAELLESELFGHHKGAFTGAIAARVGRFELAEGGTLFLDEIGDMSLDMQVKLLRVLQERTFERVGSGKTQTSNVRIVAATHKDLPAAVASGEFREDLFYRLNVFPIEMPPLFKRVSDLPQLLDELLVTHAGNDKCALRISTAAISILANYRWPGNIRELSNLVERLAIIKPTGTIEVEDLPARYREANRPADTGSNHVAAAMQFTHANLKEQLQGVEQDLITRAMDASDGVVAQAARLLNVRRTTLVEKIGKYKLAS